MNHARPVTDAFGTRLDPEALVAGLGAQGLVDVRLVLEDGGFVVQHAGSDAVSTMKALTWLRSVLSPLVPARLEDAAPQPEASRFTDLRTHLPALVTIGEAWGPETLAGVVDDVLRRLGATPTGAGGTLSVPDAGADWAEMAGPVAGIISDRLVAQGFDASKATLSLLVETREGPRAVGQAGQGAGPHFLALRRRGGESGVRPALILVASSDRRSLESVVRALEEDPSTPPPDVLMDGLAWSAGRRPIIAVPQPEDGPRAKFQILVDPDRCTDCGLCAQVCPTDYLGASGVPVQEDPSGCIRCHDCVEACPQDALRPVAGPDTATLGSTFGDRPGWLSRLRGVQGPPTPALFPPSYLLPKPRKKPDGAPTYVLGLAIATMQEHAAALVKDGVVVGAIEEERLVRKRHYGWSPEGRSGVTICMDPRIGIEEALARRSVRVLLETEGLTLDDVDVIALNGIPARWRRTYSIVDDTQPLQPVKAGRVLALPHHLAHAASAFRASGFDKAWVFTVDGRGDRETASLSRAEDGRITRVFDILSYTVRSIGGTYETVTRTLGFGSHGQGSTMALAALGTPKFDFTPFLSARSRDDVSIDEPGPGTAFSHLQRRYEDPFTQDHYDLAASLQAALEQTITTLLRDGGMSEDDDALCLGGGVTLNCKLNGHLRRTLRPQRVFAQPGANDAGTALGAALEAWAALYQTPVAPMAHSYLGPEFSDDEIEAVLKRSGYAYRRVDAIEEMVAERLLQGQVLCWFQGAMEFGPRALGSRSIIADPRSEETKARVNRIKDRQDWRPFAPSILEGHEADWFEDAFDSRFMLFAVPVRADKRDVVPAIVHLDGSTRPQSVHEATHPRYHAMISAFHRRTGVPLIVNTSFNRRGEPIVCTPKDALESFRELDVDALAIGSFLVEKMQAKASGIRSDSELAALHGGRRLLLRLTVRADTREAFNTLRDMEGHPDRSFDDAIRSLAEGREAGCNELVILRGEAALRTDLPTIIERARRMGYRFVQLQTSGRPLAHPGRRQALLAAGIDAFEVTLLASDEATHDALAGEKGAFRETATAIQALAREGRDVLVLVPVVRANALQLGRVAAVVHRLGAKRMQFNFPRPVELETGVPTHPLLRLAAAGSYLRRAAQTARELGLEVTTEGFPFCHLEPDLRESPDAKEDFARHRVDDLHLVHETLTQVRREARPEPPPCRSCRARENCPKTWALYQELFGTEELKPL